MMVEGLDICIIGLFLLVGQVYIFKFFWVLLMDCFMLFFMGCCCGWLVLMQVGLVVLIVVMVFMLLYVVFWVLVGLVVLVVFLFVLQDIVFDVYSIDVLYLSECGVGVVVKVFGYWLVMLVLGGLVLYLVDCVMGWSNMYLLMVGLMVLGIIMILWLLEFEVLVCLLCSLQEVVVGLLWDFFLCCGVWVLLVLIVFYKLGDVFVGSLLIIFFICGVGFFVGEVGIVNKMFGLVVIIVGVLYGGMLMVWLGLVCVLLFFGVLQVVLNLGYWVLVVMLQYLWMMGVVIGIENICGGMGMVVFVVLLMVLCNWLFLVMQYVLLLVLVFIGCVYVGLILGYFVEVYGWFVFYLMIVVFVFFGLVLLWWMCSMIGCYEVEQNECVLEV